MGQIESLSYWDHLELISGKELCDVYGSLLDRAILVQFAYSINGDSSGRLLRKTENPAFLTKETSTLNERNAILFDIENGSFDLYASILTDNQSGSSGILRNAVDWLCDSLASGADPRDIMSGLREICQRHGSMALLQNLKTALLEQPLTISAIQEWMENYRKHEQEACRHFSERLTEHRDILVYSNSGILESSLVKVPIKLHVYCMESRPGREGIVLAEKLARSHHRVTLLTDLAAFSVIERVDALAFGCDAITPQGIVNKIGTAALAAAARATGTKNYFVGTSEKKLDFWKKEYLDHQGSREEIYSGDEPIQVQNFYFDLTPLEYVSDLFLESGPKQAH